MLRSPPPGSAPEDRNEGKTEQPPAPPPGRTTLPSFPSKDRRGAPATSRFCARTVQVQVPVEQVGDPA